MSSKAVRMKDKNGNNVYPCPYYPVGSVYISVISTDPSTIFGGVWQRIKDVFLLACGDIYENGAKGGEAEVTLGIQHIPPHNHSAYTVGGSESPAGYSYSNGGSKNANFIQNAGGGQPHNNMPPYQAVYAWYRIS